MERTRFYHSLRTRVIFWNAVILAVLFAALGLALVFACQAALIASVDHQLRIRSDDRVRVGLPRGLEGGPPQKGFGRHVPQMPRDAPYTPSLIDTQGNILPMSRHTDFWDKDGYASALKHGETYNTVEVNQEKIRVASRRFPASGPAEGVIQAPYRVTEIYEGMAKLRLYIVFVFLPIALLGAALSGAWLTNRTLKPVSRITKTAAEIEAKDLSRRLPIEGEDEFARLSATFNAMLDRLSASFSEQEQVLEQLKRFTGNASHDLQTPLSVIKANASLMLSVDPTLEDALLAFHEIENTADSMSKLVSDMLLLARSDAGKLARDRSSLDVSELLERAVARVPRRPGAPIHLVVDEGGLTVQSSEGELTRLLLNLLDNARRYTPVEGRITVSARREGERLLLTVSDNGAGIAPEHLPHLGERFYRAEASRARSEGGTGLGLSICRSIAEAHGGTLAIESGVGVGTSVTVSLPHCRVLCKTLTQAECNQALY
jgi:two-component system OmpR family sensor kinase